MKGLVKATGFLLVLSTLCVDAAIDDETRRTEEFEFPGLGYQHDCISGQICADAHLGIRCLQNNNNTACNIVDQSQECKCEQSGLGNQHDCIQGEICANVHQGIQCLSNHDNTACNTPDQSQCKCKQSVILDNANCNIDDVCMNSHHGFQCHENETNELCVSDHGCKCKKRRLDNQADCRRADVCDNDDDGIKCLDKEFNTLCMSLSQNCMCKQSDIADNGACSQYDICQNVNNGVECRKNLPPYELCDTAKLDCTCKRLLQPWDVCQADDFCAFKNTWRYKNEVWGMHDSFENEYGCTLHETVYLDEHTPALDISRCKKVYCTDSTECMRGQSMCLNVYNHGTCINSHPESCYCVRVPYLETGSSYFSMSGDCDISGDCVSSSHYPNYHTHDDVCFVKMLMDASVTVSSPFFIETCCDNLIIGGTHAGITQQSYAGIHEHPAMPPSYQHPAMPPSYQESYNGIHAGAIPSTLTAETIIEWTSDWSVAHEGWQLCFSPDDGSTSILCPFITITGDHPDLNCAPQSIGSICQDDTMSLTFRCSAGGVWKEVAACCSQWTGDCYNFQSAANFDHACSDCGGPDIMVCPDECVFGDADPRESNECSSCCKGQQHETPWNCMAGGSSSDASDSSDSGAVATNPRGLKENDIKLENKAALDQDDTVEATNENEASADKAARYQF